jgi:hypothetical protein
VIKAAIVKTGGSLYLRIAMQKTMVKRMLEDLVI